MKLDHLMWACSDLEAGVAEVEALTGVKAESSGSHPGLGTRNALLSLGEDCYLEIIAPDPAQSLEGNFGGRLSQLTTSGLLSFAMAESNLNLLRDKLLTNGYRVSEVQKTTRDTQSGDALVWELLFVQNVPAAPFFIDWLDCVHPAKTSPSGCLLKSLDITLRDPSDLKLLLEEPDNKISYQTSATAESPTLRATLASPRGDVVLQPMDVEVGLF